MARLLGFACQLCQRGMDGRETMTDAPDGRLPLEGRTAVITGASRGIGLAVAQRLVQAGARVCITARKDGPLQEVASTFPAGSVLAVAGKADDPVHRAEVFAATRDAFGPLDILISNVGINPVFGPLADLELDAARKLLEVNVIGTLAWVQDAMRLGGLGTGTHVGVVVAMSSVTGQVPSPGIGWYGVSKAAIGHLTRTLAVELAPGIRVNAVAPAVVKTQFARDLFEGNEEGVAATYPMNRLGLPADVAGLVCFLATDEASWITGQVVNIDGGLLAAGGHA